MIFIFKKAFNKLKLIYFLKAIKLQPPFQTFYPLLI